jgi:hypothetical protein
VWCRRRGGGRACKVVFDPELDQGGLIKSTRRAHDGGSWHTTAQRQADVAEDDADRGALAAQPETAAPYPDWRFDVMTRGGGPVR